MKLKKKKKFKGQDHGLAYMNREEMKAMNAMKDSPGFIGRMARVGEQMPMNKRDGYPSLSLTLMRQKTMAPLHHQA